MFFVHRLLARQRVRAAAGLREEETEGELPMPGQGGELQTQVEIVLEEQVVEEQVLEEGQAPQEGVPAAAGGGVGQQGAPGTQQEDEEEEDDKLTNNVVARELALRIQEQQELEARQEAQGFTMATEESMATEEVPMETEESEVTKEADGGVVKEVDAVVAREASMDTETSDTTADTSQSEASHLEQLAALATEQMQALNQAQVTDLGPPGLSDALSVPQAGGSDGIPPMLPQEPYTAGLPSMETIVNGKNGAEEQEQDRVEGSQEPTVIPETQPSQLDAEGQSSEQAPTSTQDEPASPQDEKIPGTAAGESEGSTSAPGQAEGSESAEGGQEQEMSTI